MKRLAIVYVLLGASMLGGCGFFSRPKNTFYSLEPIAAAPLPRSSAPGPRPTPIGIDGIELPPGLDRRGIVVRGANHTVDVRGTHQWTAPLEEMVIHTLGFNLASRLPEGMVVLPGQTKPAAMRGLSIVFGELAPGPEPVFVLDAHWTMEGRTTHERIEVPMPSMESAAVVVAMNQALAALADRIAAGV